jgi:hypothetical protein
MFTFFPVPWVQSIPLQDTNLTYYTNRHGRPTRKNAVVSKRNEPSHNADGSSE